MVSLGSGFRPRLPLVTTPEPWCSWFDLLALAAMAEPSLVCVATYFLWVVLRPYFVKTALDNLPGPRSPSILFGNLKQLYDKQGWAFHRRLEQYGPISVLHGRFGRKIVYVFDPKAMHAIAVKEQYVYDEARWFLRVNSLVLGPGLLATTGEQHRQQRKMLNPAFNINHMREMIPIFYEVTHKVGFLWIILKDGPKEINMVNWMGRTAVELIGQSGLGYSFDSLAEENSDTYGGALKLLVPSLYSLAAYLQFLPYIEAAIPLSLRRYLAERIPHKGFQQLRRVVNTLHDRALQVYTEKKSALSKGDEGARELFREGKDLMSIMLRANMAAEDNDRLSDEELIGQMSTLTTAAMDTTSNALSMILDLLAKHPAAQTRLRRELLEARKSNGGKDLGYDELVSLPYLDAVCRETLRLFPPALFRFRETREDVVLPLSEPVRGRDGTMMHEVPIPKDTSVFVGIYSSNTRKALWGEDAYEWKPERWLSRLPEAVMDAKIPGVYSNLMTFWGGGRACIGFKFSQLEMKVVLAVLLSTFTFEHTENEIKWNLAGIIYPSVGDEKSPSLPLKVGLVATL
ncbi:cytochrome P450 [Ganoderma sinense ZZ0214-1]|uniref:Cytochrome P450 n=1 Tax=Ganoderma sinense ZZ0214-1 TaxID=1077348 RepID=A0A2G8RNK9_9APHY|nr:cytochrome P450 [Ganoderma sinense ZZ0214-1]